MKFITSSLLLLLVILFLDSNLVEAKHRKGTINSKDDWVYITKFCFDSKGLGNLTWSGKTTGNSADYLLVMYDDESQSWPYVYKHRKSLSCAEKVEMSKGNRSISGETKIQPFSDPRRPHYWFFVVANCAGGGINFEFDFEFTNAGGSWERQFSFDDQGLAQMYVVFFVFYLIGLGLQLYSVIVSVRTESFHPVFRFLTACVLIEFFYIFFMFIDYLVYKNNGIGVPALHGMAWALDIAFQLLFMLFLILLAKGWAISKPAITDKIPLLVLMSIFFILYLSMFIWGYVVPNYTVLYIYESAPGIIILVVRVLTLIWFLWCLRKSVMEENHPSKREFYVRFAFFSSTWFILLPFIVVVAAIVAAWARYKIVEAMYVSMNAIALAVFGFLFWPSRAANYFAVQKSDLLLGSSSVSSPYETL